MRYSIFLFFIGFILLTNLNLLGQSKIYLCQDDRIIRSNLDGSNVEDFITNISPAGLSIDHSMGLMFWSDLEQHKIFSTNLNGSNTLEILTYYTQPNDIELDTINHKIYWAGAHSNLNSFLLHRANYDGTNQEHLYQGLHLTYDLILDQNQEKIYWVETSGNLSRVNTDFTDFEILYTNSSNMPRSITLNHNEDKIYFTELPSGSIYKSNFDGSDKQLFLSIGAEYLTFDHIENILYGTAHHNINGVLKGFVFRINSDQSQYEIIIDSLPHNNTYGNRRIVINHFNNPELCSPIYSEIDTIVCGSYIAPDGQIYDSSEEITATLLNQEGCDSIITINLLVINIENGISQNMDTLMASEPWLLYQWVDCNNNLAPIPNETNQIFVPTESGSYAVQISVGPCTSYSECIDFCISTYAEIDTIVCDTYIAPDGQTYDSSGEITVALVNQEGCDSIISINLIVEDFEIGISQNTDTLVANQIGVFYQWVDCNNNLEPIVNETNQFFIPSENGNYAVQLSSEFCSTYSDCFEFLLNHSKEIQNNFDVLILPNPASKYLNIFFNQVSPYSLKIVDLNGKTILLQKPAQNNEPINIENLSLGVYFAVIQFQGQTIIKKFIKM